MENDIVFWHWWAFGALLLVVELLAPGMFFLWMAESAFVTGVLLWIFPTLGWESQLVWFSLLSVASIVIARKFIVRHPTHSDHPLLNQRAAQYIGRVFILTQPIVNGEGKLRIDDSTWKVAGEDAPGGSRVRVVGAEGVILRVERFDAIQQSNEGAGRSAGQDVGASSAFLLAVRSASSPAWKTSKRLK